MIDRVQHVKRTQWLLVLLMLVAFGLRVYKLESQSLWSDEGLSLYRARLALGENLSNVIVVPPGVPTRDTNPPLYFVALSVVRAVAGESEYALRFWSVIMGVLTAPLLYVTSARLFSPLTGLLAAVLGTFSPLFVWYSQETRMYTTLIMWSLASVYALLRAIEPAATHAVRRWVVWMLVTAAALYTHFTLFFLLPFEGVLILATIWRLHRRWVLAAVLGLIVLGLPIGLYGWSRVQTGIERSFGFRPLYSIVEELSSAFAVGRTNETFQPIWTVAPSLLLISIGSVVGLIKQRRSIIIVGLYLLIPLFGFYAVTFVRPLFSGARHLILIAPPFYLLTAYGLACLWQRARVVGALALATVLIIMGWWLHVQFSDPAYLKDDVRSAACTIASRAKPDDVVVVHDAISSFVFDYYYTRCGGRAPWRIIPTYPSLDIDAALKDFQHEADSAARLWFVTNPHPLSGFDPKALDAWARGHLLRLDHQIFPSIWMGAQFQLYTAHFPVIDTLPASAQKRTGYWPSDDLHLAGLEAPDRIAPGQSVPLALYWRIDQPGQRNLATTVRLVDQTGAAVASNSETMFDNWSVRQWPVGKIVRQDTALDLPADLPSGEYHLRLTVNERKSAAPLDLADGSQEIEVAALQVRP